MPDTPLFADPSLSGSFSAEDVLRPLPGPVSRFYWLSFNNGEIPDHVHWLVAKGTPEAVRRHVVSDVDNEVKGRPRRIRVFRLGGRRVEIYRFPAYPAGGVFGGHDAALVRKGGFVVIASIHGRRDATASARMAVDLARPRS